MQSAASPPCAHLGKVENEELNSFPNEWHLIVLPQQVCLKQGLGFLAQETLDVVTQPRRQERTILQGSFIDAHTQRKTVK